LDWGSIREFYERGHSIEECKRRFGFSSSTWDAAVCRGDVVPRVGAAGILTPSRRSKSDPL
jgi:hypothetical protein